MGLIPLLDTSVDVAKFIVRRLPWIKENKRDRIIFELEYIKHYNILMDFKPIIWDIIIDFCKLLKGIIQDFMIAPIRDYILKLRNVQNNEHHDEYNE